MEDLIQRTTHDMWQSLVKKQEELIKETLIQKGYDVEKVLKPSRFPQMVIESNEEWDLYFCNDGTEQGEFIIAFQKPKVDFSQLDGSYSATSSIKYTTNFSPLFKNK